VDSTQMFSSMFHAISSSRQELLIVCVSSFLYIILCSIRTPRPKKLAKDAKIKVDASSNPVVATNVNQLADDASMHLSQILESMECCKTDATRFLVGSLNAFLNKYTAHAFTSRELQTILDFCTSALTNKALADRLFEHVQPTADGHVLQLFIGFYLDNEQCEKACDIFELNYAAFFDVELDEQMEWRLLMSALKCGHQSLADLLLQTSRAELAKHVVTIQQCWRTAAAKMSETRVDHMGDVMSHLADVFNQRYPFQEEEHSDAESTCILGDDSDWSKDSDVESSCGSDLTDSF